jgi:hypothetical protein
MTTVTQSKPSLAAGLLALSASPGPSAAVKSTGPCPGYLFPGHERIDDVKKLVGLLQR